MAPSTLSLTHSPERSPTEFIYRSFFSHTHKLKLWKAPLMLFMSSSAAPYPHPISVVLFCSPKLTICSSLSLSLSLNVAVLIGCGRRRSDELASGSDPASALSPERHHCRPCPPPPPMWSPRHHLLCSRSRASISAPPPPCNPHCFSTGSRRTFPWRGTSRSYIGSMEGLDLDTIRGDAIDWIWKVMSACSI
jgi:hypothetical protein